MNGVFNPKQQRELHFLFGGIRNAGSMGLRSPITFDDLCENLRRMSDYLERHGRWIAVDRKELNELRRQREAVREYVFGPRAMTDVDATHNRVWLLVAHRDGTGWVESVHATEAGAQDAGRDKPRAADEYGGETLYHVEESEVLP